MATDKEYQAVISALSSECERLHKAINNIRAEVEDLPKQPLFKSVSSTTLVDVALEIIDKHR